MLNRRVRLYAGSMEEMNDDRSQEMFRRISIRWKIMLVLGTILIALGLFVDWPPQEADLPDTASFLVILGGLLGSAGLLAVLRRA
ncbi:MAG: hypothetical protein A4E19_06615 [Nitrospira sp. SG-bin1]|nr:MAG: hypothetical protein A4E19_06615 [Nitrospira sp. SG-bin1]